MKSLLLAALFLPQISLAAPEVVYGEDNRTEPYLIKDQNLLKYASATAGMINLGQFTKSAKSGFFDLKDPKIHGAVENLCTSERFYNEPTAPICSGFLVAPDTIVTAGHCYKMTAPTPEQACASYAWVFDYKMTSATSDPTKNIPVTNIYMCKSVISVALTADMDYTIVKLDRPVVGRTPLTFRKTGKVDNNASLVVIGHPSGLPQKISPNGKVTVNTEPTRFATTLDTFHGNSGSAVLDAKTGIVEGILIQGKTDYVPSIPSNPKSCNVVNKCQDDGKTCPNFQDPAQVSKGEVVLRITTIANLIPGAK